MSRREHPSAESTLEVLHPPYYRAALFRRECQAARVYARIQDVVYQQSCDLSVYRFLLDEAAHVAVLGHRPPTSLDRHLHCLLADGQSTTLSPDILLHLLQRRAHATQLGPWVERHYGPGGAQ